MRQIMKGYFARKASNLDDLKEQQAVLKDGNYGGYPYTIEKVIELSKEDYKDFTQDFFEPRDFIKENIELMYVDREGLWHCILVKAVTGKDGVLIEAEGYDYARYTCYIQELPQEGF